MANSPDVSSQGPKDSASRSYGPDWVGLDRRAMLARRDAQRQREREARQREAERQAEEIQQLEELMQRLQARQAEEPQESASSARAIEAAWHHDAEPRQRPRPSALIDRIYIENLRSLAGQHEVPLAPLTLVYGPNSAGKSTVLNGLKVFMKAVNAGRGDALQVWRKAFVESAPLRSLITWEAPNPEDPFGVQWRSQLVLGIDFKSGDGERARAELSFEPNPIGTVDYLTSRLGTLGEAELSCKSIGPEDPDPDPDPQHDPARSFGEASLTRYLVREKRPDGSWTSNVRVADAELFAHPSAALKADLFAIAYLMRYLGPHRGEPAAAYVPLQGPFNKKYSPYEIMDYDRWGVSDFGGYEVLNQMMRQLEIPYKFEQRPTDKEWQPERAWDFRDDRSGALVGLGDVGYGVGQLLPVIDVCVHARQQVICIEEPELHLHPRLQSTLGNLFATSVLSLRNQVILETHSESILLRVRRLIRRGKLLPDEVAVLYVDNNDEDGATVRRLRLGTQGELLDPWPTGFYDTRLEDVLGGWE